MKVANQYQIIGIDDDYINHDGLYQYYIKLKLLNKHGGIIYKYVKDVPLQLYVESLVKTNEEIQMFGNLLNCYLVKNPHSCISDWGLCGCKKYKQVDDPCIEFRKKISNTSSPIKKISTARRYIYKSFNDGALKDMLCIEFSFPFYYKMAYKYLSN